MKKIFIYLILTSVLIGSIKASIYEINIVYPPTSLTDLCVGDTLRFRGDSTNSGCYGVVTCLVYNEITESNSYYDIVTLENVQTSADHILTEGDKWYDIPFGRGFLYFNCTSVELENIYTNYNIEIFPNPSSGIINLKTDDTSLGNNFIIVYDLQGKVIQIQDIDEDLTTIDITNEKSGLYIIKLNMNNRLLTRVIQKE